MEWWMWLILVASGVLVVGGVYAGSNPKVQDKLEKNAKKKGGNAQKESFNEDDLKALKETAQDFLEFESIDRGMISFTKDPHYFTMAFGVNGVNISMYSTQERLLLKNGFMSILNTLKDDIQILVQSRYVDLSDNFKYFKPVIETCKNEREILTERIKDEPSEVVREKMIDKVKKLERRNFYANHIIDFFNFYTRQADCISLKVYIVVSYRYTGAAKWDKKKIADEAYNSLINKVKILKDQFNSIKLKTYELSSAETADIIYSTLVKNEGSYLKIEDAIKNGILDLAVETAPGDEDIDEKYNEYEDDYKYTYKEEAAITSEDE